MQFSTSANKKTAGRRGATGLGRPQLTTEGIIVPTDVSVSRSCESGMHEAKAKVSKAQLLETDTYVGASPQLVVKVRTDQWSTVCTDKRYRKNKNYVEL